MKTGWRRERESRRAQGMRWDCVRYDGALGSPGSLGSLCFGNRRWDRSKIIPACISSKSSVTMAQVHRYF